VDPQTRAQRTLYTSTNSLSSDPAWLPDQTSFVYASNSPGNWSLVRALTAAPNAAVRVIAAGDIAPMASSPTISPDGTQVAFTVVVRDTAKLSVINLDGSRFTQLGDGDRPAWSPDGKLLAFSRQVGENSQIFTVNPATGTELTQVTSGAFDHRAPAWSPDSRRVVFSTDRGAKPGSIALNLYAINKDGTGLTQLTTGDALNISPEWGKDNWIYFAAYQGDNFDIWRMKLAAEGK
jgi:Tol biopolymer transport system component